jgi:hypothetical protein
VARFIPLATDPEYCTVCGEHADAHQPLTRACPTTSQEAMLNRIATVWGPR